MFVFSTPRYFAYTEGDISNERLQYALNMHRADITLLLKDMCTRLMVMDQDTRWLNKYEEVMTFIETNRRNPSRHRIEEHDFLNWLKANRKVMNAGKMKAERMEKFRKLLELIEQYRRKNQYV